MNNRKKETGNQTGTGWFGKAFSSRKKEPPVVIRLPRVPQVTLEKFAEPLAAHLVADQKNADDGQIARVKEVIDYLAKEFDRMLAEDKLKEGVPDVLFGPYRDIRGSFFGAEPPDVTIKDYLLRFRRYTSASVATFIYTAIFLDIYLDHSKDRFHDENFHHLILASLLVAYKFVEPELYPNKYLATVGGVSLQELNKMELEFNRVLADANFRTPKQQDACRLYQLYEKYHKKVLPLYGVDLKLLPAVVESSLPSTVTIFEKLSMPKWDEDAYLSKLVTAIGKAYKKGMREVLASPKSSSAFKPVFEGSTLPIDRYVKQFVTLERISAKAFLHMTLLIDAWCRLHERELFSTENAYGLIITSLYLAHEYNDDENYLLGHFAERAGIRVGKLIDMTRCFEEKIGNQFRYTSLDYRTAEARFLSPEDQDPLLGFNPSGPFVENQRGKTVITRNLPKPDHVTRITTPVPQEYFCPREITTPVPQEYFCPREITTPRP